MIEIVEDRTLLAAHVVSVATGTGAGSLYGAINAANADTSGPANVISFDSTVTTVELAPGTALPELIQQVTIEGGSVVTIDGGGTTFDGFRFSGAAASSIIRNLTIQDVQGAAILIQADQVTVEDNVLGAAGETIGRGVLIDGSSSSAATNAIHGNTIGFATAAGVEIRGGQATDNLVFDNRIGTDASGADRGNLVGLLILGSPSNQVGVGGANTIGFNDEAGVRITGAAAVGNLVQGNRIGVDSSGNLMGNPIGVEVTAVSSGAATVILDNDVDAASTAGVRIAGGATNVQVRGNRIGLEGTTAARKNAVGVLIESADGNTIGGSTAGFGNTIGLAATAGVVLRSTGANTVAGNLIGTNASGADLGNLIGVWLDASGGAVVSVVVGGSTDADANTIVNSGSSGVRIQGASAASNTIERNRIGFNAAGAAMGNPIGILLVGSGANEVLSNRIGNSSTAALQLLNTTAGSTVDGNVLGFALDGSTAAPNYDGIEVFQSAVNAIGLAGTGNRIGFSTNAAIAVAGTSSTANMIQGNTLGLSAAGAAAANLYGVTINAASSNLVGGGAAGELNVIGFSTVAGVQIAGTTATGNAVLGNRIGVGPSGEDWGNAYGVQIVNSSANAIGSSAGPNTIGHNDVAGIAVFAGAQNTLSHNSYVDTNGAPPIAAADINIAAGANGGIQPLAIATASPDGTDVKIRFSLPLAIGDVVQVYGFTTAARTFAAQQNIVAATSEITIPAAQLGGATSVVATVARAAQGTSAFSNVVGISSLLVVDTTAVSAPGKTSLWDAINNANALGAGLAPGDPAQVITFDLPDGSIIDTSSTPLPVITTKVAIDGPDTTTLTIQGTGLMSGLTFSSSTSPATTSSGSSVADLTFTGFGTAIQIVSAGVTVQTSVFNGNAVGVAMQGGAGSVVGSAFLGSTTAGVLISGAAATGNEVVDSAFGPATAGPGGNSVGVLIQNASDNVIGASGLGNTFQNNLQSGVTIQSGDRNVVRNNDYKGLNGPAVQPQTSDVVVVTGANGGILAPTIATVSPSGADLLIRFTADLEAGDVVQVYGIAAGGRTYAASRPIVAGSLNQVSIPASDLNGATTVVVSVTRSALGTSAFSNAASQAELFVVNTVHFAHPSDKTSLWDAIANVNFQADATAPTISFDLPDSEADDPTAAFKTWTIDVSADALPTILSKVVISGLGQDKLTIRGSQDGLVFASTSGGSTVAGLNFTGFAGAGVRVFANETTVSGSSFIANPGTGLVLAGDRNKAIANSFGRRRVQPTPPATDPLYVYGTNAVGVEVQGIENQVGDADAVGDGNLFLGSTLAGVLIVGQGAAGNTVFANEIGPDAALKASNPTTANNVGVLITQGASGNSIGGDTTNQANTIRNSTQQGVSIQSGNRNSISSNLYSANGPLVGTSYSPSNAIVISPGANDGIPSPQVVSLTKVDDGFYIRLSIAPFTSSGNLARIQVYQLQGDDLTLLEPQDANPNGIYRLDTTGVYGLWVRVKDADASLPTVINITEVVAGDPSDPTLGSTGAFSAAATPTLGNVVVNTADYNPTPPGNEIPGTLRFAVDFSDGSPIIFRLPTQETLSVGWTIGLMSPLHVDQTVLIDGWDTGTPLERRSDGFLVPQVYLVPKNSAVGIEFVAGGEGAVLRGLRLSGFGTAVQIQANGVQLLGNQIFGGKDAPAGTGVSITAGSGVLIGALPYRVILTDPTGIVTYNPGNILGGLDVAIEVNGTPTPPGATSTTFSNSILNNQIGLDGLDDVPNVEGIVIHDSGGNWIVGNVVGNSGSNGIRIDGDLGVGNRVAANQIGVATSRPIGSDVGNQVGISIGSDYNVVGSVEGWDAYYADTRNLIGRNEIGIRVSGDFNAIAGNLVGADADGRDFGNTAVGIALIGTSLNPSEGNAVGAVGSGKENVIGWNPVGVSLQDARGNALTNNFIGFSPFTGNAGVAIPNDVGVKLIDSTENVVGPPVDPDPARRPKAWETDDLLVGANIISGNRRSGIALGSGALDNTVRGNLVGRATIRVPDSGTTSSTHRVTTAGNVGPGIEISSGGGNTIGNADVIGQTFATHLVAGLANLLLGNQQGVYIAAKSVDASWTTDWIVGNQIAQNALDGVLIEGDLTGGTATVARIVGNFIGVGFDGTSLSTNDRPTGNGLSGVALKAYAPPVDTGLKTVALTVSGTVAEESPYGVEVTGNLISSNGLNGVGVEAGEGRSGSSRILIAENILGLALDGSSRLASGESFGNVLDGVRIANVSGVEVGRARDGWSNVISGNLGRGVEVDGAVAGTPGMNTITNNLIGTDFSGDVPDDATRAPGNLSDGVFIFGNANTTIARNLIGGNRAAGINVAGSGVFSGSVEIRENWIGTSQTGVVVSNGSEGVFLSGLTATKSGAIEVVDNVIGANRANGVHVQSSRYVDVRGNMIGDYAQILVPKDETALEGNFSNGVFLNFSNDVRVERNTISGNRGSGIVISGKGDGSIEGNRIADNAIGADLAGVSSVANYNSGILISGSSGNQIDRNVLSGNRLYGVVLSGAVVQGGGAPASRAEHNTIDGNFIGVTRQGTPLANSADGVFLLNAAYNTIGGDAAGRNIISSNEAQGVRIFGLGSFGNVVAGNYIGLGIDGATKLGNKGNGVTVDNAGANTIGAANVDDRNVISGNDQSGIQVSSTLGRATGTWIGRNDIGTDASGSTAIANGANGVFVFGASGVTIDLNVISGNRFDGVQIFSPSTNAAADGNIVRGNRIGTDATGLRALGNQGNGVSIINGFGNLVGFGDETAMTWDAAKGAYVRNNPNQNVISGNANGVVVDFQAGRETRDGAQPNQVSGNIIGLGGDGRTNLGNRFAGVLLDNAVGTVVGYGEGFGASGVDFKLMPYTVTPGPGWASNVVSGNGQSGIHLTGKTTATKVAGNYLGTDVDGRTHDASGRGLDLASTSAAVLIDAEAVANGIGGITREGVVGAPGTGNLITQSRSSSTVDSSIVGVRIESIGAGNNLILANVIGLDADGLSGSNGIGVLLNNAVGTTIGGAGAARNVITGNAVAGVEINGPLATENKLFNNYIGTHSNGATRPGPRAVATSAYNPSQEDGVLILQSSGNTIGYGTFAGGLGNLISGNGNGVNIASLDSNAPAASTNFVIGNRIGTDASGMNSVPNFRSGVFITAAPNNEIRDNLISANGLSGIQIYGGQSQQGGQGNAAALGTTIAGNTIGLNAAGEIWFSPFNGTRQIRPTSEFPAVLLPNDGLTINLGAQQHGVVVIGASGNRIGLPGNGNNISGNTLTGVYITKLDSDLQSYATPVDNVVQSNWLKTNGVYGVFRYDAPNGNPALEPPSADANDFTGSPIPIGDFVTGLNSPTPSDQAQSILLGNTPTTPSPNRPGRRPRPAAPTPSRPAAIQRPALAGAAARIRNR